MPNGFDVIYDQTRFSGIYRAPASWIKSARTKYTSVSGQRQLFVRVQRLVGLPATCIAFAGHARQVSARHVTSDIVTIEARRLELGQLRIGLGHRALQRFEILVDQ